MVLKWRNRLQQAFLRLNTWLWQTKAIWLRTLLCLSLGVGVLLLDEKNSRFDQRFQLRGTQPIDSQIAVIQISSDEWTPRTGTDRNLLRALKEYSSINDRFFWNPKAFERLIRLLLKQDPKAIGVNFFFPAGEDAITIPQALKSEKIVWAAKIDGDGRPTLPVTASNYGYNVGILNFSKDEDGVVRRFSQPISEIPHFVNRLVQVATKNQPTQTYLLPGESQTINYMGGLNTYPTYTRKDLNSPEVLESLKDKIILIGSEESASQWVATPFGNMPLSQFLAHVTDNYKNERWIHQPKIYWFIAYLAAVLALVVWLLLSYPQSAALVFLFWLGTGLTALSLWVFDTFYIWIPVLPPLAMMAFTYIIFLGYQLTLKENINWRLQQEKKFLFEVEQLKHNFVSLISHDLKTPIAKIQAFKR